MTVLTGRQRRFLRARANTLDPSVMIGKQGLSDAVLAKIEESLTAHELIKVRFLEFKETKKTLAADIAKKTGAALAGIIGHVAIFYRPCPDSEKRTIQLPKGDA